MEVLRIFGSFAATTTLNSEISRFVPSGGDNRGQFLDLSFVPRNAGGEGDGSGEHADGRARTKRATNHRRKEEGRRMEENNDKRRPRLPSRPARKKGVVPSPTDGPHPPRSPSSLVDSTPLRLDIRQPTHDSFTL